MFAWMQRALREWLGVDGLSRQINKCASNHRDLCTDYLRQVSKDSEWQRGIRDELAKLRAAVESTDEELKRLWKALTRHSERMDNIDSDCNEMATDWNTEADSLRKRLTTLESAIKLLNKKPPKKCAPKKRGRR